MLKTMGTKIFKNFTLNIFVYLNRFEAMHVKFYHSAFGLKQSYGPLIAYISTFFPSSAITR